MGDVGGECTVVCPGFFSRYGTVHRTTASPPSSPTRSSGRQCILAFCSLAPSEFRFLSVAIQPPPPAACLPRPASRGYHEVAYGVGGWGGGSFSQHSMCDNSKKEGPPPPLHLQHACAAANFYCHTAAPLTRKLYTPQRQTEAGGMFWAAAQRADSAAISVAPPSHRRYNRSDSHNAVVCRTARP